MIDKVSPYQESPDCPEFCLMGFIVIHFALVGWLVGWLVDFTRLCYFIPNLTISVTNKKMYLHNFILSIKFSNFSFYFVLAQSMFLEKIEFQVILNII